MHESLRNSAQLTMDMDVNMDDAVKLRTQLISEWESQNVRPTYTDLVVKAAAKALRSHPLMNSTFGDTEISLLSEIHVGIAVAIDAGLVVPVVRNADALQVRELALESARLASLARDGKLGLDDMAGGTFTVIGARHVRRRFVHADSQRAAVRHPRREPHSGRCRMGW